MCAAHRQGILHRDLKPENVMLTVEGRLKVLDFGLAKLRVDGPDDPDRTTRETRSFTLDGWIVGTVAYMSPEQAQGLSLDHRSDIFSLGILLYEMATGERPFKGNTNLSVLASILKDVPPSVTEVRSDIPRPLARMIQRALERRPEDRYPSAMDLRRDLEDLKRDVDTGELRVAAKAPRRAVAAAHTRRHRLSPDRPQADPDRSCARPVLGRTPEATDLGHACLADSLVCLRRTSRATVVAFVTDGPGLRDVLDHLGLLQCVPESPPLTHPRLRRLEHSLEPGRWEREQYPPGSPRSSWNREDGAYRAPQRDERSA